MFSSVDTHDPAAVAAEAQAHFLEIFPSGDKVFIPRAFGWVLDCFSGFYLDYLPIDARYHDLEHTLQGTLCFTRIFAGLRLHGAGDDLGLRDYQLGLLAILLHDTGYLKHRDDADGTGAKYTLIHVARSAEFAGRLMAGRGFGDNEILSVQNMIQCTGVNADLSSIPFQNDRERRLGHALATADLVGQMAASDYVDKLDILFEEFLESNKFFEGTPQHRPMIFQDARDLIQKTPGFWRGYVLPKLSHDFANMHLHLGRPGPGGTNEYLNRIEENIARIDTATGTVRPR